MNLPADRMNAANGVINFLCFFVIYKLCVFLINPSIIAYERMSFYAYISIVEVLLKLLIVLFLKF